MKYRDTSGKTGSLNTGCDCYYPLRCINGHKESVHNIERTGNGRIGISPWLGPDETLPPSSFISVYDSSVSDYRTLRWYTSNDESWCGRVDAISSVEVWRITQAHMDDSNLEDTLDAIDDFLNTYGQPLLDRNWVAQVKHHILGKCRHEGRWVNLSPASVFLRFFPPPYRTIDIDYPVFDHSSGALLRVGESKPHAFLPQEFEHTAAIARDFGVRAFWYDSSTGKTSFP